MELNERQAKKVVGKIRNCLQKYFLDYNLKYAVFGKSEGLDSSVVAGLLSNVPGVKPIGVIIPIHSKPEVSEIAREVLDFYHIPKIETDQSILFDTLTKFFNQKGELTDQLNTIVDRSDRRLLLVNNRLATGNIKARIRMITLYYIANILKGLVISTDNFSEWWTGFWTLNGDVGDLSPIQQVFKGDELYVLAKVLKVPKRSLDAPPADGLEIAAGSFDKDQLMLDYHKLDEVILEFLRAKFDYEFAFKAKRKPLVKKVSQKFDIPVKIIDHVALQISKTWYKRHWPRILTREEIGLDPV